jgi:hypothetical protein
MLLSRIASKLIVPHSVPNGGGNIIMRIKLFRAYGLVSISISMLAVAYLILLNFPQPLFAYSTTRDSFQVYSREPIRRELNTVLESAEARLRRSSIYNASATRRVYLTDSHGIYALLSHKAYKSFANSVPFVDNMIINKSDVTTDRVFLNREKNNTRSLSGVIAHEVTHLFIRQRYGTVAASLMPTWKNEGYCEYIAGDSTISLEEGIRLWRENPTDDTGYRYIKYHLMVKHLLENETMSLDDLLTKSLDEDAIAARTFAGLPVE